MLNKLLCKLGIHRKVKVDDKGITCLYCGFFKDKYEHQADLHAGGGW